MKILIGCEESQEVCKAFRAAGHEAFSCDLQGCSGGHPEWHLKMDVFQAIKLQKWDMLIAHPVCQYLCNSGVRWLWNKDGTKNEQRWENMRQGALFFRRLLNCDIPLKALENPIPHKYALEIISRRYTQVIQPHMFGHPESKATCLWLEGVPLLIPTSALQLPDSGHWNNQTPSGQNKLGPSADRARLRSKTYAGIAQAMAEQWAGQMRLFDEKPG